MKPIIASVFFIFISVFYASAQESATAIPSGAKIFIAPIENGFTEYLAAAMKSKKVPIVIVANRSQAQFEITGNAESRKASTAKKLFRGSFHSDEEASIKVTNIETASVVFAYSANKGDSAHGMRSSAEACAKHLKEKIEKGK